MLFEECEAIFVRKCNAQNLSEETIRNYKYCLKTFFDFCRQRNISDIEQVNRYNIMDYMAYLNDKYSSVTACDKFIILKAFFTCMTNLDNIPVNPMENMRRPKVEKTIINSFSQSDIKEIMNGFDKSDFIGYRNYTIMCLLFATGIRKSELLDIELPDIDWATNLVKIYGKGRKERLVPLGNTIQKVLLAYLRKRKEYIRERKCPNNIKLFITKDGHPLSKSGLDTVFSHLKLGKKSWSTRVSAHTFRHTFAKFFLLNGGDLFSLQKILGHEDISTTRIYVDLNNNEMKVQNDRFNPLDNNRWQYY